MLIFQRSPVTFLGFLAMGGAFKAQLVSIFGANTKFEEWLETVKKLWKTRRRTKGTFRIWVKGIRRVKEEPRLLPPAVWVLVSKHEPHRMALSHGPAGRGRMV